MDPKRVKATYSASTLKKVARVQTASRMMPAMGEFPVALWHSSKMMSEKSSTFRV